MKMRSPSRQRSSRKRISESSAASPIRWQTSSTSRELERTSATPSRPSRRLISQTFSIARIISSGELPPRTPRTSAVSSACTSCAVGKVTSSATSVPPNTTMTGRTTSTGSTVSLRNIDNPIVSSTVASTSGNVCQSSTLSGLRTGGPSGKVEDTWAGGRRGGEESGLVSDTEL